MKPLHKKLHLKETGKPRSCVLSSSSSCPPGFKCTLVGGTTTRCCGKSLGCPPNSAASLHPSTGSHMECSPSERLFGSYPDVCPAGQPLGGAPTVCGEDNTCQDGYQCVTAGSFQYCCPSRGNCSTWS
ncbi:hypothetical protein KIN20_017218 [Parelaphostrongylus tenuis]|uniref:Uncharacterized protein n=1 Tax=Parelaphostrongylus tenuis TaxID=148309 RepID=A0AAD5QRB8_PARTN|nr:hypothetical protein KIN20_017218 [Parelaphostrongylus tenuis]